MQCVIRREKGGKSQFVTGVDSTNAATGWCEIDKTEKELPAKVVRLSEEKADAVFTKIGGKKNTGTTFIHDVKTGEVLKSQSEPLPEVKPILADLKAELETSLATAKGKLITLPPGNVITVGEDAVVATATAGGPFDELHKLLNITAGIEKTTLRDVAAAALQEIKDLRAMVEADPDATKLTDDSTPPAGSDQ